MPEPPFHTEGSGKQPWIAGRPEYLTRTVFAPTPWSGIPEFHNRQEARMSIKAALITVLSLMMIQPAAAGASRAQDGAQGQPARVTAADPLVTRALPAAMPLPVPQAVLLNPFHAAAGDITGGRGPSPHARALADIAVYASIGNTDGVAMLSGQLRAQGVSREAIRRAIDGINVHGDAFHLPPIRRRHDSRQAEAGWEASQ
jgi:hypothetical protein